MNNPRKLKKKRIVRPRCLLLIALILAAASAVNAQGDRSERLQEKVKTTDDRINIHKVKAQSRRINSPAFRAVRIAEERAKLAKQKLAEVEKQQPKKKGDRLSADPGTVRSKRASRLRSARAEFQAAELERKEAKERLEGQ